MLLNLTKVNGNFQFDLIDQTSEDPVVKSFTVPPVGLKTLRGLAAHMLRKVTPEGTTVVLHDDGTSPNLVSPRSRRRPVNRGRRAKLARK